MPSTDLDDLDDVLVDDLLFDDFLVYPAYIFGDLAAAVLRAVDGEVIWVGEAFGVGLLRAVDVVGEAL